MREDIVHKAKKIKLLVLDSDGVLTEGSIIYDSKGRDLRVFNVKDGLGVFLLSQKGVDTVVLTARGTKALNRRIKDMRVKEIFFGVPKEDVLDKIMDKYKVSRDEVCFLGDDLIDIKASEKAGLSIAVSDACGELKEKADLVTEHKGGKGAVREVAEIIMKAKGVWDW